MDNLAYYRYGKQNNLVTKSSVAKQKELMSKYHM